MWPGLLLVCPVTQLHALHALLCRSDDHHLTSFCSREDYSAGATSLGDLTCKPIDDECRSQPQLLRIAASSPSAHRPCYAVKLRLYYRSGFMSSGVPKLPLTMLQSGLLCAAAMYETEARMHDFVPCASLDAIRTSRTDVSLKQRCS